MTSSITALRSAFVLLAATTSVAFAKAPPTRDDDPARISVTAVAGDVAVTMAGSATDVRTDSTVNLPARIVTGGDGMLGLTQAGTNITVARDTDVEIPAEAVDGNLVARLVQHRGNVFYDVAHRDVGKLRVETPYLVAVIKGTQFNVAVLLDSTTISLFEGQLEIRTPDGSETIQLNAGQIAIRSSTDGAIRVLGMNDQRVAAPSAAGPALGNAAAAVQADRTPAATVRVGGVAGNASAGTSTLAANLDLAPRVADQKNDGGGSERPTVHIASGLELDSNDGLDARANVDVGIASAGLGVAVDSSGVDAALSAKVDLGAANVAVGVNAGVDLGTVSLGAGAGIDLGGVATDVQLGANLDLGGGAAGVAGAVNADVGLGASLDLGGGSLSADVGGGLDLGGVVADVGVGAGIDLSDGTANLGVDLGSAGVSVGTGGLGIDLGVSATDNVVALPVAPIVPVIAPVLPPVLGGGGLLGGLLGHH